MTSSVLNFATVGNSLLGQVQLDHNLDELTNTVIPDKLPIIDKNVINTLDSESITPLLESLSILLNNMPILPTRPMIDFTNDKNSKDILHKMLDQLQKDMYVQKLQSNVTNQATRLDNLQQAIDAGMINSLQTLQPQPPLISNSQPISIPPMWCSPQPPPTSTFPQSQTQFTSHPWCFSSPYIYYPQVVHNPTTINTAQANEKSS